MANRHPMIDTLLNLKGNPRACVYTEPILAIPYNLFLPYASIYMYALGVTDRQIGLIASIGMAFQIMWALLGGAITDKLGRRKATVIFDITAWSAPCLIWAFSNSFTGFVIAAIINSVSKVPANSWKCLLVEDCDKKQIVNIYAWIYIFALIAAFFAPISGFFIKQYDLIPTVRVLYFFAFIMMTLKFVLLYRYSTETGQGKIRMEETRHISFIRLIGGYGNVFGQLLKSPQTMLTLGIMIIMSICNLVSTTFWSLYVTENLHLSADYIGVFSFLRSFVMLIIYFTLIPRIGALRFKSPLVTGSGLFIISQFLLVAPLGIGIYYTLAASVILEACSLSLISPLLDSMQAVMVDPKEMARIIAIMNVLVIALTAPFGWIAGTLSGFDRRFPFMMNMILLAVGILLTGLSTVVPGSNKATMQAEE